jgi:hypothetical protein
MRLNQDWQIHLLFKRHFDSVLHGSETLECARKHADRFSDLTDSELRKLGFDEFFIKNKSAYAAISAKKYEWLTQKQIYFLTALLASNWETISKYTVKWNLIPWELRRYIK